MKTFPPELLIVLFLLAMAIFQILMKSRRPQGQQRPAPQPGRETIEPEDQEDQEEPEWTSARVERAVYSMPNDAAMRFGRASAPAAPAPAARGRYSRRSLMGNRRDLRKAIVIAAILGPCRAAQPHEDR